VARISDGRLDGSGAIEGAAVAAVPVMTLDATKVVVRGASGSVAVDGSAEVKAAELSKSDVAVERYES
jgi:hypothetical protein